MRLRPKTIVGTLICICGITIWGCVSYRFERHVVFGGPAATRVDRVRQYSLEDQYRIFRYGNDVVEPPMIDLAKPIAERGGAAIPFLLKQLDAHSDDTTLRDILAILYEMKFSKTYDVNADATLMEKLNIRVISMKDGEWRGICSRMLQSLRGD